MDVADVLLTVADAVVGVPDGDEVPTWMLDRLAHFWLRAGIDVRLSDG